MSKYLLEETVRHSLFPTSKRLESIHVGDQVHVNHVDCEAGRDTRERLYVKRNSTTEWVAYCHNCGLGGVIRHKKTMSVEEMADWAKEKSVETLRIVPDRAINTYGAQLPGWKRSKGTGVPLSPFITQYMRPYIPKFSGCVPFLYNNDTDEIEFILDNHSKQIGTIRRCFNPNYTGPKWKILLKGEQLCKVHYWYRSNAPLIIVEDVISAAIAFNHGFSTLALLRTRVDTPTLLHVVKEAVSESSCPQVLVALDKDIAGMKGTTELLQQLSVLGIPATNFWENWPGETEAKDFKDLPESFLEYIKQHYGV